MGTRADFYVGRGAVAEWIGSIAWDGYPKGIDAEILASTEVEQYRGNVTDMLARADATLPEQGWPWPWEDSRTTDYAYAFDDGQVWASRFGGAWFDPREAEPGDDDDTDYGPSAVFPDMSSRQATTFGRRSGLIVFGPRGLIDDD